MKTIKVKDTTHTYIKWVQTQIALKGYNLTIDRTIEFLFDFWNSHAGKEALPNDK